MPLGLSPLELLLILIIVLIVVGPGKLPGTGAAIGKAIREFREALEGTDHSPSQTQGQSKVPATQQSPTSQPPQQAVPQQPVAPQGQGTAPGTTQEPPRQE